MNFPLIQKRSFCKSNTRLFSDRYSRQQKYGCAQHTLNHGCRPARTTPRPASTTCGTRSPAIATRFGSTTTRRRRTRSASGTRLQWRSWRPPALKTCWQGLGARPRARLPRQQEWSRYRTACHDGLSLLAIVPSTAVGNAVPARLQTSCPACGWRATRLQYFHSSISVAYLKQKFALAKLQHGP